MYAECRKPGDVRGIDGPLTSPDDHIGYVCSLKTEY